MNPSLPPQTAVTKGPPTQIAQIMPPANLPTSDSGASKTEFAIDLGGEMSIDGLRALGQTSRAITAPRSKDCGRSSVCGNQTRHRRTEANRGPGR
jgi:hypothetical protein